MSEVTQHVCLRLKPDTTCLFAIEKRTSASQHVVFYAGVSKRKYVNSGRCLRLPK